MPLPLHRLPDSVLSLFKRAVRAAARVPVGRPPTIDGFVLDREVRRSPARAQLAIWPRASPSGTA